MQKELWKSTHLVVQSYDAESAIGGSTDSIVS